MLPNFSKDTLSEMIKLLNLPDDKEYGFILYNKNNEIFCGKECVGTNHSIQLDSNNYKNIIGSFHTHPNINIIYPSYNDFQQDHFKLICVGIKKVKRILCYERKINNCYINDMMDRWFYSDKKLEIKLHNKYFLKNLSKDSAEFNEEIYKNGAYFKNTTNWAKNVANLFYKYEIDINTLRIKSIGY